MSQAEIAREEGVSEQAISDRVAGYLMHAV